jgi:iron complex outermembrane receptor protein
MVKRIAGAVGVGVLVLLGWTTCPGAAEKEADVVLEPVVVTASRQEEKTVKVPALVTVVTAEDIQQSTAQNVAEVLSMVGGIHVMDTGGNKRNYWVDLRGFGESAPQNLLLLVDGRRVNLPDLSGPDWNLIPLERIARIEVIRGSRGSVIYGDNATQGVINIITKEGRQLEGTITAQYGSYDTFRSNGAVSGATERLSYDLTVDYLKSDGYRDNSDADAKDIGANLRIDPTDALQLQLSAGYHYDDTRNPGAILESDFEAGAERTDTFSPNDFSKVDDYYVKAGLGLDMLTNDAFNLELSVRKQNKKSYGSSAAYWFEADTKIDIFSLSPQLIFRGDFDGITNRVTLGADYSHAKQDYDNYSEYFGFPSEIVADLEKDNSAVYFQDELGVGSNLSISGGYRLDRVVFTYKPATPVEKRVFDEEAYNFGINYAFSLRSHVYGSYTHSFRYPVLDEQFYYFNSTVDTGIVPQSSNDYELGAAIGVTDGLVLTIELFRSETENEIFFNFASGYNENMDGKTIRQGAELGLNWQWKALTLGGTYTYTHVDIDGGTYDGKEFPFVPEQKATGKALLKLGRGLSVGLDAIYVGQCVLLSDFNNDYDKVDDYTVVNGKILYQWRKLTFFADLNNIFSEEYSTFSGLGYNSSWVVEPGYYPAPDFNVMVGVTARFGGR